jgi:hypothetical protein
MLLDKKKDSTVAPLPAGSTLARLKIYGKAAVKIEPSAHRGLPVLQAYGAPTAETPEFIYNIELTLIDMIKIHQWLTDPPSTGKHEPLELGHRGKARNRSLTFFRQGLMKFTGGGLPTVTADVLPEHWTMLRLMCANQVALYFPALSAQNIQAQLV